MLKYKYIHFMIYRNLSNTGITELPPDIFKLKLDLL